MDPRHVTRSYIFIGGEERPTAYFLATLFWLDERNSSGRLQQPLFKIRIAESLQIDFFGAPAWGGNDRPRRLGLMDFIIITFFQRPSCLFN